MGRARHGSTPATSRPSCGNGCSSTVCARPRAGWRDRHRVDRAARGRRPRRRPARGRRPERDGRRERDRAVLRAYSGRSYTRPDPGYPRPLTDDWWNLPDTTGAEPPSTAWTPCSPAATSGPTCSQATRFVVFDNRRPLVVGAEEPGHGLGQHPLRARRRRVPRQRRQDLRVRGPEVRPLLRRRLHPGGRPVPEDHHRLLGHVVNPITRTGHVDAALVVQSPAGGRGRARAAPHLPVLGRQYVRYEGTGYATSTTAIRATSPHRCAPSRGSRT